MANFSKIGPRLAGNRWGVPRAELLLFADQRSAADQSVDGFARVLLIYLPDSDEL